METFSTVVIGCLNLVVIYGPIFLVMEFVECFKEYRSQFSIHVHIATVICYALVTLFYPVLVHGLFETFASPWRFLKALPSAQKEEYGSTTKSSHKNWFIPEGGVDPIDIQPFMLRTLDEAKEKRARRNWINHVILIFWVQLCFYFSFEIEIISLLFPKILQ